MYYISIARIVRDSEIIYKYSEITMQNSKIYLGFHDFHCNRIIFYLNRENVSPRLPLVAEFDRDIQNWEKISGTG